MNVRLLNYSVWLLIIVSKESSFYQILKGTFAKCLENCQHSKSNSHFLGQIHDYRCECKKKRR